MFPERYCFFRRILKIEFLCEIFQSSKVDLHDYKTTADAKQIMFSVRFCLGPSRSQPLFSMGKRQKTT